jgi:hypothetical protein|tara:strand:- start:716 stop:901 length:186 start_codon:yes stop_codon:yes gene_type:complete
MKTGRYRLRRGYKNVSVLQYEYESPYFIAGQVDSSVRVNNWVDVKFDDLADIRVEMPKEGK